VQQSGISILGDQRGAAVADFDGDGRVDVAVAQNGAPMTLWRNIGGTPGLRVTLTGPAGNPLAIGAQLRIIANGKPGPVRELHAGSGYWSMDAVTTVLALPANATELSIRWPDNVQQTVAITPSTRRLTLAHP
jgi:hypothetical protein